MIMGLTGGIATGKSTVSKLLTNKGAIVIDADQIAREVVMPGQPTLARMVERFGHSVLLEDGTLNRKHLGEIIFSNPELRKELEAIIHPAIRLLIRDRTLKASTEFPDKLIVADIPLLYESGQQYQWMDEVMVVYAPRELQLSRMMQRDGLSEGQAQSRLAAQLSIEEKKKWADHVIDNTGSLSQLASQIDSFWVHKRLP